MQRMSLKTEKIKRTEYQRNINNQRSDSCYLSVWSISPTTMSLIISLDPANSSSTSAELGLCFVDLIWFSELIVDAAIYARTYSSRWRSKSLVQPLLPSPPASPLLFRFWIHQICNTSLPESPAEPRGSKIYSGWANLYWRSWEFLVYLHVCQTLVHLIFLREICLCWQKKKMQCVKYYFPFPESEKPRATHGCYSQVLLSRVNDCITRYRQRSV